MAGHWATCSTAFQSFAGLGSIKYAGNKRSGADWNPLWSTIRVWHPHSIYICVGVCDIRPPMCTWESYCYFAACIALTPKVLLFWLYYICSLDNGTRTANCTAVINYLREACERIQQSDQYWTQYWFLKSRRAKCTRRSRSFTLRFSYWSSFLKHTKTIRRPLFVHCMKCAPNLCSLNINW